MTINYKNIEISIFRSYEGKYGVEHEHLNTVKGEETEIFEGEVVDIEDIMDAVRETLECEYTTDKLAEEVA